MKDHPWLTRKRTYKINRQQAINIKEFAARKGYKVLSLLNMPWVKFEKSDGSRTMLHINKVKLDVTC